MAGLELTRRVARPVAGLIVATAAALLMVTLLPVAFGWESTAVLTGSMRPGVSPGDVVVAGPAHAADLRVGRVVLFRDRAHGGRLLLHRISRVAADGRLVTRGDANDSDDAFAVALSDVVGLPRLRVPWVGLPVIWLHDGQRGRLALGALAATGALVLLAWGQNTSASSPAADGGATRGRHSRR